MLESYEDYLVFCFLKKIHYKAGSILLLIIAAFIAYGLYTQCPGVAVYRRC